MFDEVKAEAIKAMQVEGAKILGVSLVDDRQATPVIGWDAAGSERERTYAALEEMNGKIMAFKELSPDDDLEHVARELFTKVMGEIKRKRPSSWLERSPNADLPAGCEWVATARNCPDGWDVCWQILIVDENLVQEPPTRHPIIVPEVIDLETVDEETLKLAGLRITGCGDMV